MFHMESNLRDINIDYKKITIELLIMCGVNALCFFSQMYDVESNYHVLDTQLWLY